MPEDFQKPITGEYGSVEEIAKALRAKREAEEAKRPSQRLKKQGETTREEAMKILRGQGIEQPRQVTREEEAKRSASGRLIPPFQPEAEKPHGPPRPPEPKKNWI